MDRGRDALAEKDVPSGHLWFVWKVKDMSTEAILSNDGKYTVFTYGNTVVKFMTSPKLERYTKVLEWGKGYIVVMAQYNTIGEVEEYIDLVPILKNLYIDSDEFVEKIKKVKIKNG